MSNVKSSDTDIRVDARARVFHGPLQNWQFLVEISDGTVRAWDQIGGHYTIHNGLDAKAENRIRKMAGVKPKGGLVSER